MSIALTEQDRLTYDTSNLRNLKEQEEADSGTQSTPPMWSPPRSTYNGTMSPNSRVQAIARGQRELMDMVSRMPEACYELSLKDMVDHQHRLTVVEAEQETPISNSKVVPRRDHQNGSDQKKKKKKKAVVMRSRSGSFDNGGGLFLKMVFPVSFGSTKKGRLRSHSKGRGSGCVVDGRVSPRPLLLGEGDGHGHSHSSTKKVEEDEEEEEEEEGKESLGFSSSGKSESSKSTGVSSRSSSRNSTGQARFSCWSCIYSNKDKKKAT